ncbi:hypothetical protein [Parasphingorhabdus sp.]|uniref:hypothetical protein n=1 Tax=Parasphingorhabdus sp. TaxID=2709688 RepID=UPI0035930202
MNFPHEMLARTAIDEGADGPAGMADHQTLLARVIARQASTPSAQDYVAASLGVRPIKVTERASFLDERMAFFAGRFRPELPGHRGPKLFRTGCFRPDLAQRKTSRMHG